LGGQANAGSVLVHVQVVPTLETNVLRVVATADSRARATRLASAYVQSVLVVRWRMVSSALKRRIATLSARPAESGEQVQALQAVLRGGADPTVQIAQPPTSAVASSQTPAALVAILAAIGGLFLGVLVTVGAERLNGRILDAEDARHAFRVSIWGEVPAVRRRLRRGGAIVPSTAPAQVGQVFDALATRIAQSSERQRVFGVTSPSDRDGRTTVSVAIAAALARQGHRTALVNMGAELEDPVDADLRAAGVSVVAAREISAPLNKTLRKIHSEADLIIIDGPPVGRGIELLASVSARLLLVVRVEHTRRGVLREAWDVLQEMDARPLGMVVLGDRR
jgi:capsular polysaccharide biosynthesis protein